MAIQEYVSGEDFKKLIDDKLINANSVKQILKKCGIFPVYTSQASLSDLVYTIFLGSGVMSEMQQVMNFEQSSSKSTMLVIDPKNVPADADFVTNLSDEFIKLQRIPTSVYQLKNIYKTDKDLMLQYCYTKPQRGRIRMADKKEITLDVQISQLADGKYKANIRHEGISESKQFVSLLEEMIRSMGEEPLFAVRRITLDSLQKSNKVDFFDNFGTYQHKEWTLVDITNVTVNKSEKVIDEDDSEELAETELEENEPTGKLTGISSAILTGDGLRNNDFVKECMQQNFIFSSMRYKWQHKSLPIVIELDITFKQKDLKISITKTWKTEDDGRNYVTPLPESDQSDYINYFQNIAYLIYSDLIQKQRLELEKMRGRV